MDYKRVLNQHLEAPGDITVVYKNIETNKIKKHPEERILRMDQNGKLLESYPVKDYVYDEPTLPVSMNIYFLSVRKMLEIIARSEEEGLRLDADRLVSHYLKDYDVNPREYPSYLALVDSIESYYEANMELLDKEVFNELFNTRLPIMTKVKNEAPTYYSKTAKVTGSLFATGCVIEGTVDHSLIFRKVKVAEDAVVKNSIIMQGSKIGKGAVLEYCILDKNVVVQPGVELKGTPDNLIVLQKNKEVVLEEEG
ncbi:glucose-1-phosphate adenylyltransferase subunit GlgD [Jeotgalibaca sp. MA1X17-3]|uniref:glucose-1-phosphate adenylyltransferase subunit GlgD n=1 Tax=Jeotgalibaca sp. MA1X17-3 TaxID=2908211 RepID=UPI001F3BF739|nr:glucose-1-phosphate adenylyltransferase subunit GlgD [Jeotgalibaca sp. MA1X17-3]UJF16528.1 glucose-1-phosphate adenylyltransferase subunit GlgD [Jeotgalibaca sp. MA1X17-3]